MARSRMRLMRREFRNTQGYDNHPDDGRIDRGINPQQSVQTIASAVTSATMLFQN